MPTESHDKVSLKYFTCHNSLTENLVPMGDAIFKSCYHPFIELL